MNVDVIHASIESFLRQRIDKKVEAERKKLKEAFTDEHLSKIHSRTPSDQGLAGRKLHHPL